jgi:hypothetical protein
LNSVLSAIQRPKIQLAIARYFCLGTKAEFDVSARVPRLAKRFQSVGRRKLALSLGTAKLAAFQSLSEKNEGFFGFGSAHGAPNLDLAMPSLCHSFITDTSSLRNVRYAVLRTKFETRGFSPFQI